MPRRRLKLETAGRPGAYAIIELVPGPHPYLWIGDDDGECYGTVDVSRAEPFLTAALHAATKGEERDG